MREGEERKHQRGSPFTKDNAALPLPAAPEREIIWVLLLGGGWEEQRDKMEVGGGAG